MDRKEITAKVVNLVAEHLYSDPVRVTAETTLESLGGDSLDQVEIVMQVEDEFGIEITDEEGQSAKTVGAFVDLVVKNQQQ